MSGAGPTRDETLARLDAIQARSLERLQEPGTDRALLVELLEAACLLELAKIETTRVDPASYLQHAVDVIAQMYPVHGVAATVSVPGCEPIEVHAGEPPDRRPPLPARRRRRDARRARRGRAEGRSRIARRVLRAGRGARSRRASRASTHSEQLRREAATATASRVASQLPDEHIVDGLEELALALASFPSVIAAELVIDHVAVGPPLRLRSGYWDSDGHPHSVDSVTLDLGAAGRLTARIRSVDESPPDELAVQGVMEYLACSLDRIATTQALREQAETEPLTGLGNRRRLQRALDQHLSRARALRRAGRAAAARPRPVQGRERRARARDRRRGDRRVRATRCASARAATTSWSGSVATSSSWSRRCPTCSTRAGSPRTCASTSRCAATRCCRPTGA